MGQVTYDNYATLVACALKGGEAMEHWCHYLKLLNRRREEQSEILKVDRKKYRSKTDDEILSRYTKHLMENFSVPSFPWTIDS